MHTIICQTIFRFYRTPLLVAAEVYCQKFKLILNWNRVDGKLSIPKGYLFKILHSDIQQYLRGYKHINLVQ